MADRLVLGMFHDAGPTADTIEQLRAELGVPEEHISVMSGIPYTAAMLGRKHSYERLVPIALAGALGGLLTGLFLTVGTPLLYPLVQNGQPYIPIPPTLIILFELTMMGTVIATFAGLLAESQFPVFGRRVYDDHVTEGHISVLVQIEESRAESVEQIFDQQGAHHVQRQEAVPELRLSTAGRWGIIAALLIVPALLVLLFTYGIIAVPVPNQMENQDVVGPQQGPRLAAPAAAIPVQGPALIDGQPASEPLPATEDSIQRGEVLYSINCEMCHGETGNGRGHLATFFTPPPADLTGDLVQNLPDDQIYQIITEGRGIMPSIAENLSPNERWDVINYVRSLAQ